MFTLHQSDYSKRITVEFDGMFRNSTVWLNGHYLGSCLSGYTSCQFDITELCNYGQSNALAVRTDATEYELWSYEGGGIYRNVRLIKTHPVHVDLWGTFVQTEIREEDGRKTALVRVAATVCNETENDVTCTVVSKIQDPHGRIASTSQSLLSIQAAGKNEEHQELNVPDPELWRPASPALYKLITTLTVDGDEVDSYETPFGIRNVRFDPETGNHGT